MLMTQLCVAKRRQKKVQYNTMLSVEWFKNIMILGPKQVQSIFKTISVWCHNDILRQLVPYVCYSLRKEMVPNRCPGKFILRI